MKYAIYAMLTGRADYVKEDQSVHDKRYRERAIKSLQRRAQALGMTLTINPV